MIACFFHQPALRRHLDDGEELSAGAKAHLEACPKCREMLAGHRAIIERLSARRNEGLATPAFLHARIMNNLDTAALQERPMWLRWAAASAFVAVIATAIVLSMPKRAPQPVATWPGLPTKIAFKTAIPENPLEQEIQDLRADTMNAARALAATFLPETDSK